MFDDLREAMRRAIQAHDELLSAWIAQRDTTDFSVLRGRGTTTPQFLESSYLKSQDEGGAMQESSIHQCRCPKCDQSADHPDKELHHNMNLLLSRLDEQQRRLYAAVESKRIGHGGDRLVSLITGLNVETIRHGRHELDAGLADTPMDRIRRAGGGRPPVEKKIWLLKPTCSA